MAVDPELNPGEELVSIFRRHIINLVPIIVSTVLVVLVSTFAQGWLTLHQSDFPGLPVPLITTALMVLSLLSIAILVIAFFIFRQNRVILTNQHVIEITQSGLFGRTLSKFSLDELQDVRGSRTGFFATILNYGEVLIETAGEEENFLFRPVGDPLAVAEVINDTHEQFERAHTFVHP